MVLFMEMRHTGRGAVFRGGEWKIKSSDFATLFKVLVRHPDGGAKAIGCTNVKLKRRGPDSRYKIGLC